MGIVARPKHGEPCLISGNDRHDLLLYDLDGSLVVRHSSPCEGWTHDSIEVTSEGLISNYEALKSGWDAYLGDKDTGSWIGSSEV